MGRVGGMRGCTSTRIFVLGYEVVIVITRDALYRCLTILNAFPGSTPAIKIIISDAHLKELLHHQITRGQMISN